MIETARGRARCTVTLACLTLGAALAGAAQAQQPIIYPSKGQSAEQQGKDKGECYGWAQQTTGVDPLVIAQRASQPVAEAPKGGAAKGAVGGAVAGTAIGAIAGDAGKGAAIGAVTGTMAGGRAQRRAAAAQQKQAQQQQKQNQEALNNYNRAFNACMEGRGYVIK